MKTIYIFILSFFLVSTGCKGDVESTKQSDIPGTYFELDKDKINIFLPAYFQKFSEDEYDALINALPDSEEKRIERKRFNFLKYTKGNIYYFKDIASSTLISVKMGPYTEFNKEQSTWLLTSLTNSCSTYAELMGLTCERLNAGYSGSNNTNVFKAAYKMTNNEDFVSYNTMYIISSNYKSFGINIFSNTNKNYNSFIEKIVVK